QLRGGDRVDVDLGAEHRLEAGVFGGPREILDFAGAPPRPRDRPERQPFRHDFLPCSVLARDGLAMRSTNSSAFAGKGYSAGSCAPPRAAGKLGPMCTMSNMRARLARTAMPANPAASQIAVGA